MKDKSYVTMEQKLCPVCGELQDTGALLLDKKMKDEFDTKTTTGYKLCKSCQKKKDKGYVAIIICDEKKTVVEDGIVKPENAYRTGEIIHIKEKVAKDIFNIDITKKPFVFGDTKLRDELKKIQEELKNGMES